jgi:tripartite ATP-independent transporter DctP family solute receptor
MKMKKILAVVVCVVMLLALAACGSSTSDTASSDSSSSSTFEPQTWKMAMSGGETSTWADAGHHFADLISEKTGGAITVEIYPSDQLTSGSQTDGIQALMDGTTELSMHSNLIYSSFDDRFSVVSLPFLFDTTDEADSVLDGTGGEALKGVLSEYGLHCMGIGENGFRHVTNNKREIKTPDDMKDLVIRVAGSSVLMEAYKDWGANYTKANWSEVYTGLQTGTYDGQENPMPTADSASIQEVQKYLTYWTGSYDCLFFCMNGALYDSLDPELQQIVDECGQETCEYQREINRAGDADIIARWESENGVVVHNTTEEEAQQFIALSNPVYSYYADLLKQKGMTDDEITTYLQAFGATTEGKA